MSEFQKSTSTAEALAAFGRNLDAPATPQQPVPTGFQPAPQQQAALQLVRQWFPVSKPNWHPYFYLAGFAGTGKSTILPWLIQRACGLRDEQVIVCSLTAQAARVAGNKLKHQQLDNVRTSTIHGLLYTPTVRKELTWNPDGTPAVNTVTGEQLFERKLDFVTRDGLSRRNKDLRKIKLIIIDEAPMAPQSALGDLLELGIPVLLLGDTAQLPPIGVPDEIHVNFDRPHYELTEILRQKGESQIIDIGAKVRQGYIIEYGTYGRGDLKAMNYATFHSDPVKRNAWMQAADQIIVATNAMRHLVNQSMRQILGLTGILAVGDKLICLKNNKDIFIGNDNVTNGLIAYVEAVHKIDERAGTAIVTLSTDDATGQRVSERLVIHLGALGKTRSNFEIMKMSKQRGKHVAIFDYAYAITCHKAQGSEWDNVIILYEPLGDTPYARWVYPAMTRASKNVLFVSDVGRPMSVEVPMVAQGT